MTDSTRLIAAVCVSIAAVSNLSVAEAAEDLTSGRTGIRTALRCVSAPTATQPFRRICRRPTVTPTPSVKPTAQPTSKPTQQPAPSVAPTSAPSPTMKPTASPSPQPTQQPAPSVAPTNAPSPTVKPTDMPTPRPTVSPVPNPTPQPTSSPDQQHSWQNSGPPDGAVLSRAYKIAISNTAKGYQPKSNECSAEIHGHYWTIGPDGKVYPTWHPPIDPSGCAFGHEHGDDPRTSRLYDATGGWPAFGYTNELLAPDNPASQRDEDHVGHKVAVLNQVATHPGNNPGLPADMICDTLLKLHQGTHSPDALTNNLHELYYNAKCVHTDNGDVSEAHVKVLLPIGHPGSVNVNNGCDGSGTTVHDRVGPYVPPDSPDGGFSTRRVPDPACAASVVAGQGGIERFDEFWQLELHVGNNQGLRGLHFNPYMAVLNPARYYDPAQPKLISRTIDLCYQGAKGAACDKVRALSAQQGGVPIAWDDVRSPFNGGRRRFDPNRFIVMNTGPTTLYSDVFGQQFSATPFPGSVEQFVSGNRPDVNQGDIFQRVTDYAPQGSGVHAPN